MTVAEKIRRFEKLTDEKIRMLAVGSVHLHEQKVVLDSILANHPNYLTNRETPSAGKTFAGNEIAGINNFSDWDDSYKFHDNLKFLDEQNIEFTSTGKGFEAIKANYNESDYIAPTAKVLSDSTMNAIKKDFINNIDNVL